MIKPATPSFHPSKSPNTALNVTNPIAIRFPPSAMPTAVFLLRLYDGSFDKDLATWRESIHSDGFFGEVLSPITNGVRIDEDMIESVIEAGYNFAEVRLDTAAEIESQEELLRRIERK